MRAGDTSPELSADMVIHNGRVATLTAEGAEAEAVAVIGDRVVSVGSDADVRPLIGRGTRVLDLKGRRVIPGMADNHTHYMLAALDTPEANAKVGLARSRSIEEIKEQIAERARSLPEGEWIATSAMYRGALKEGRFPDRHDLDAVSPRHPVYVMQSGKNIIVNSYALRMAGIDRDTPDPVDPEGHIVRDREGEPTGHLIAGAADIARLRWWKALGLPPKMWDFLYFPQETLIRGLVAQGRAYAACGIVAVRDMGVSVDELDAYVVARRTDRLPIRVDAVLGLPARYLSVSEIERRILTYFGPKQGVGDDWLRIGGLKLVVQNDGWWAYSPEKARVFLTEANLHGWTCAIHVGSGDSQDAAELVLSTLEDASRDVPVAGRRFSWEHALGLHDRRQWLRAKSLGMVLAANPLLGHFGAARSLRMHEIIDKVRMAKQVTIADPWERAVRDWGLPLRSWCADGLIVTGGTDHPAVAYDPDHPLLGFYAAVTGETMIGVLMPGQQVTREQALRMWTWNNAYATSQEAHRGSIEVGKLADLVVLSDDLLTCPPERIKDIIVVTTIIGGKVVHER